MNGAAVMRGVAATAQRAGDAAATRAGEAIAARLQRVPGISAAADDGVVRVRGRGLLARVLGSRRRAADARLRALMTGDER